jgi:hypothetical protein
MLKLKFLFEGANRAMAVASGRLRVAPLPATVYMMQVDVLNHYRYALTHYFTLGLTERCLQNSSLGSPYEKWMFFTNKDFGMLSFAVHNLLRYTSRLFHETEVRELRGAERFREMKTESNRYTDLICEFKAARFAVGIKVEAGNVLMITPLEISPPLGHLLVRGREGQPPGYFLVTTDDRGESHEISISLDEFNRRDAQVRPECVDIRDRSVLQELRQRGMSEIQELAGDNEKFAEVCNTYYGVRTIAQPFANLNEEYWT